MYQYTYNYDGRDQRVGRSASKFSLTATCSSGSNSCFMQAIARRKQQRQYFAQSRKLHFERVGAVSFWQESHHASLSFRQMGCFRQNEKPKIRKHTSDHDIYDSGIPENKFTRDRGRKLSFTRDRTVTPIEQGIYQRRNACISCTI